MKKKLTEKIDSLPPLPNSMLELEDFRKVKNTNPEELIAIIKKDPLLVTTILRVANSSMFGFRSTIDTLSRAINLLGINFTISLAMGSIVQNTVKCNLSPYGISNDDFIEISALATKIVNTWVSKFDNELKEDLLMPAFLQETGKFIISNVLAQEDKSKDFLKALNKTNNITKCEEDFIGFSSSRITANIFKHWALSHNLIFSIGFVGNSDSCPSHFKKHTQALEIVKALADMRDPLSDRSIKISSELAQKYGFDQKILLDSIDTIKDEIRENS